MEIQKSQFRLPSKKEFKNLIKYPSKWNDEKKCLEINNNAGEILFLPAAGCQEINYPLYAGRCGFYWSSNMYCNSNKYAHYLFFDFDAKYIEHRACYLKNSVRLVSDTPFDGGIKFGNIYWKPENEDGYYPYEEAMEQFNK